MLTATKICTMHTSKQKIAASSAGLPMLTMWQNHHCSALGKRQWDWPEVKIVNEEQRATKVWCKPCWRHSKAVPFYLTCSPAQTAMLAFVYLFYSFSRIDVILTKIFRQNSNCSSFFQNFPFDFPKRQKNLGA